MNDIKMMIALSGSKRLLLQYEVEIFANHELTCYYLNTLCKDEEWYEIIRIKLDCARAAFRYANDVIKGRWPEAESLIMCSASSAYYYAKYVIKGRWVEADDVIASNTLYWAWYNTFLSELSI